MLRRRRYADVALPRPLRLTARAARLREAEIEPDDLRDATAKELGAKPPTLAQLRRVTWGSLIQVGLLVLAGAAVIGWITNLDFATLIDEYRNAVWGWAVAGS